MVLILQEGNSIQAELEAARWDWLGWVFLVALLGSVVLGGMSVIGPEWRRDRFAPVLLGLFVTVGLLLAAHLAKGLEWSLPPWKSYGQPSDFAGFEATWPLRGVLPSITLVLQAVFLGVYHARANRWPEALSFLMLVGPPLVLFWGFTDIVGIYSDIAETKGVEETYRATFHDLRVSLAIAAALFFLIRVGSRLVRGTSRTV